MEGRDALLFHGTSFFGAVKIIEANAIEARSEQWIAGKPVMGVSLTRDPRVAVGFGGVVFVLDQRKLAQVSRIVPMDFWGNSPEARGRRRQGSYAEAEEFVIGAVLPLDRVLVEIRVRRAALKPEDLERGDFVLKLNPGDPAFHAALARHPLVRLV